MYKCITVVSKTNDHYNFIWLAAFSRAFCRDLIRGLKSRCKSRHCLCLLPSETFSSHFSLFYNLRWWDLKRMAESTAWPSTFCVISADSCAVRISAFFTSAVLVELTTLYTCTCRLAYCFCLFAEFRAGARGCLLPEWFKLCSPSRSSVFRLSTDNGCYGFNLILLLLRFALYLHSGRRSKRRRSSGMGLLMLNNRSGFRLLWL